MKNRIAMKRIEKDLEISNQNEAYYLDAVSILYVKADGNYCDIYLTDGSVIESVGFQRAEIARMIDAQLPPYLAHQFALLGRSYLINMERILYLNANRQTLTFDVNFAGTNKRQSIKASTEALRSLRSLLSSAEEEFNDLCTIAPPAPAVGACNDQSIEDTCIERASYSRGIGGTYNTSEDEVRILGY